MWVTFNGKRFDVPFLLGRTLSYQLTPSRQDILDTYPYNQRPHADLARFWSVRLALDGLCDLLSAPCPKGEMDGSQVASALANGGLEDVVSYCEEDTVATFKCLQAIPCMLEL